MAGFVDFPANVMNSTSVSTTKQSRKKNGFVPGKSTKKKGVIAVDSSRDNSMSKGACSTKS